MIPVADATGRDLSPSGLAEFIALTKLAPVRHAEAVCASTVQVSTGGD